MKHSDETRFARIYEKNKQNLQNNCTSAVFSNLENIMNQIKLKNRTGISITIDMDSALSTLISESKKASIEKRKRTIKNKARTIINSVSVARTRAVTTGKAVTRAAKRATHTIKKNLRYRKNTIN